MFCTECGEELTLMYAAGEGLVPYCKKCGKFRFPQYSSAVIMTVTNRSRDKILLAKHKGQTEFALFAGYIKKGETAEKAVAREFREETKLNTVKAKYMGSRYFEPNNVLMLSFLMIAEDGEPEPDKNEIDEVKWFTFEEALENIKKGSLAEALLKAALPEIKKFN